MTLETLETPLGLMYLAASEKGLAYAGFEKPHFKTDTTTTLTTAAHLKNAKTQLKKYFAGKLEKFDLLLDLNGTTFQEKVWNELNNIPHGKAISYTELANRVQNPKAVRAVGGANGKNPICVIIPCHRVIAADGTLGGYSGGLHRKEKLLALENIKVVHRD